MRTIHTLVPATLALFSAYAAQAQQDPLTFSAGYTMQSDSNRSRLPSNQNPQADMWGIATFGLGFYTKQSLQTLSANVSLVDYRYQKSQSSSFTATNYDVKWQWAITPSVTGTLSTDRVNSLVNTTGFRRINSATRFDATYQLDGPWRLIGGTSTTRQENEQSENIGGEYSTGAVDAGVRYVFRSGSDLSYQMRVGKGTYLKPSTPAPLALDDQYTQVDNDLRLSWLMGTGSKVNANLTHINRTHPIYAQRDYNGFNFGAGIDWALTGKTSLSTSLSHTLDAYPANNSNYSSTNKISVSASWQISPKMGLRLKNDWAQRSYLGSPSSIASSNRQDITRDTTLSVNWQAYEQLALSASLQQSSRGVNQGNLDYDSTMLFFTAQLTY